MNPASSVSTKADANGQWRVDLAPMKASADPMDLRVTSAAGDPLVQVTDVLGGEVWLASGQSNMEWPLYKCTNGAAAIAAANDPQLRLLTVPIGVSTTGPPPRYAFAAQWIPERLASLYVLQHSQLFGRGLLLRTGFAQSPGCSGGRALSSRGRDDLSGLVAATGFFPAIPSSRNSSPTGTTESRIGTHSGAAPTRPRMSIVRWYSTTP